MIGVRYHPKSEKWICQIKAQHVGVFESESEAIEARLQFLIDGTKNIRRRATLRCHFSIFESSSVFNMKDYPVTNRTQSGRTLQF